MEKGSGGSQKRLILKHRTWLAMHHPWGCYLLSGCPSSSVWETFEPVTSRETLLTLCSVPLMESYTCTGSGAVGHYWQREHFQGQTTTALSLTPLGAHLHPTSCKKQTSLALLPGNKAGQAAASRIEASAGHHPSLLPLYLFS